MVYSKFSSFPLVGDLAQPPEDFNGDVDSEQFWKALTEERIARGFVSSKKANLPAIIKCHTYVDLYLIR